MVNLSGGTVTIRNIGATGTGVTIGSNTNTTGNVASVSGALNISGGNVTIYSGNAGYAVQLGQNVVAGGVTVSSAMNLTVVQQRLLATLSEMRFLLVRRQVSL